MINLDTCKIIVYGFTKENHYHTHSHIHEGFARAAKFMRPGSKWIDQSSANLSEEDLTNTLFITEHGPGKNIPIRPDNFYVVHGLNDNKPARDHFFQTPHRLSWNVYHDYSHVYGTQGNPVNDRVIGVPLTDCMWIGEEVPLYPNERHLDFRWATDLLPHEIEANKPSGKNYEEGKYMAVGLNNKRIWYIGTQWWVNQRELNQFAKACQEDSCDWKVVGAGQNGVISVEENAKLVRESYFAPALSGSHHLTEGYVPCRIFKNISYGMYGVTNNRRAHQVLGNTCIFHPDPYRLYFEARDQLRSRRVEDLWAQMDLVKEKHTYVNRINSILKAARITISL
jgi:hypothetical protein